MIKMLIGNVYICVCVYMKVTNVSMKVTKVSMKVMKVTKVSFTPFIIINVQLITTASFFCFLILIIYFVLYFLSKIKENFLECLFRIKKSKKVGAIGRQYDD